MLGGSTATVVGAAMVWLLLALAGLFRALGADLPYALEVLCAAAAAPIALALAIHTLAGYWRGPTILSFPRADSEACSPDEAAFIRLGAQLRGTMGGAGFLYPARLFLPATSWVAATVGGVALIASDLGAGGFAALTLLALGGATAALLFPARPYYYREATGGTIILSPPSVARRLKRRAAVSSAAGDGRPAESSTPAPTPMPASAERVRTP